MAFVTPFCILMYVGFDSGSYFKKPKDMKNQKQCTKCLQNKSMNDFCTDNTKWDGKKTQCKVCSNKNSKKWKANNKEHIFSYNNAYKEKANADKQLQELIELTHKLAKFNDKYKTTIKLEVK